jgi:RNA polymerase sigma factor (sigma-70 family)
MTQPTASDLFTTTQWRAWWEAGAWERLTPQMYELTHRICRTARLDVGTVEDIASRVAARCWAMAQMPDDPIAYVTRSVRNHVTDHYRSAWVMRQVPEECLHTVDAGVAHPLDAMITEQTVQWLHAALEELPDDQRRPLVLHHVQGRTVAEVATLLGVNGDVVKMRMSRGRQRLRRMLALAERAA